MIKSNQITNRTPPVPLPATPNCGSQRKSQLAGLNHSSLAKTGLGSEKMWILTKTMVSLSMSCAWIAVSLKCSASVLSLAPSSRRILMATSSCLRPKFIMTPCSPCSSRILSPGTPTVICLRVHTLTSHLAQPWRLKLPPNSSTASSTRMVASLTRPGTWLIRTGTELCQELSLSKLSLSWASSPIKTSTSTILTRKPSGWLQLSLAIWLNLSLVKASEICSETDSRAFCKNSRSRRMMLLPQHRADAVMVKTKYQQLTLITS